MSLTAKCQFDILLSESGVVELVAKQRYAREGGGKVASPTPDAKRTVNVVLSRVQRYAASTVKNLYSNSSLCLPHCLRRLFYSYHLPSRSARSGLV